MGFGREPPCAHDVVDHHAVRAPRKQRRFHRLVGERKPVVTAPPEGTGLDGEIQAVLDRCQAHLLETASDADAQLGRALAKLRDGSYSLDEYVGDWGELVARGLRDGARSAQDQLDLLLSAADVVRAMARQRGGGT